MFGLKINSVRVRWLRSYAIVLIIPIAMMLVIYFQTRQVIEAEINRANMSLLSQLQREIDNQIDYAYRLSEVISTDYSVRLLMKAQGTIGAEERLAMVQALSDFKIYNSANHSFNQFYLYFPGGDFVLTDSSFFEPDMYYQFTQASSGLSFEEWKRFLGQQYRGQFFNSQETGGKKQGIMFVQSLPVESRNAPLATLVIELNEQRLLTSLQTVQSYNQGKVYIMDGVDHLLAASESGDDAVNHLRDLNGESGVVYRKWNGEDVVLSYKQSDMTKWKYIYVLPARVYSGKAEYVRSLTALTVVIALVIGTVAAFLFSRQLYDPLRKLVHSVAARSKLEQDMTDNEYDYLESAIEKTMDHNQKMNTMLQKQKHMLRANLLVRLLKGRIENDFPVADAMTEYGMHLRSDDYAVMLFYLEDFSGFFHPNETDLEKRRELVSLIMTNIIEETVSREHQGWMFEIDELLVCIVNFAEGISAEEAKRELSRVAEEAQIFIGSRFRIFFTIAVSSIRRSAAQLPSAYQEALEAMEYKMLHGTQTILFYDDIRSPNHSYSYPLEKEQQLINYVKAGDFSNAKGILEEVITGNVSDERLSIELVRCLMFDMISTMMKAAIEVNLDQSTLYKMNIETIQELMNRVTVSAMRDRMTAFLVSVCEHVNARKRSHNDRLKESVLDFINDQYRDHNLSVNTVSDHFGIHPSYLSRYFKEQVGDTLTDYINKLRMEKAKDLLLSDAILIKDICDLVGVYSVSTFIRLFKKYEGVTPSVYRESHKVREP